MNNLIQHLSIINPTKTKQSKKQKINQNLIILTDLIRFDSIRLEHTFKIIIILYIHIHTYYIYININITYLTLLQLYLKQNKTTKKKVKI